MSQDERAIRDLIARWHSATAAGDIDAILPLMSEDATFLRAGAPPMVGRGAFESALGELFKSHFVKSTGDAQEVCVSGDIAYSFVKLHVTITSKSGDLQSDREGHTLSILRKQADGQWVLSRDANLLAPPQ
jgi:uncharacterized protein (TIGR02246 family)